MDETPRPVTKNLVAEPVDSKFFPRGDLIIFGVSLVSVSSVCTTLGFVRNSKQQQQ